MPVSTSTDFSTSEPRSPASCPDSATAPRPKSATSPSPSAPRFSVYRSDASKSTGSLAEHASQAESARAFAEPRLPHRCRSRRARRDARRRPARVDRDVGRASSSSSRAPFPDYRGRGRMEAVEVADFLRPRAARAHHDGEPRRRDSALRLGERASGRRRPPLVDAVSVVRVSRGAVEWVETGPDPVAAVVPEGDRQAGGDHHDDAPRRRPSTPSPTGRKSPARRSPTPSLYAVAHRDASSAAASRGRSKPTSPRSSTARPYSRPSTPTSCTAIRNRRRDGRGGRLQPECRRPQSGRLCRARHRDLSQ